MKKKTEPAVVEIAPHVYRIRVDPKPEPEGVVYPTELLPLFCG